MLIERQFTEMPVTCISLLHVVQLQMCPYDELTTIRSVFELVTEFVVVTYTC